jgi:hypothetical protein
MTDTSQSPKAGADTQERPVSLEAKTLCIEPDCPVYVTAGEHGDRCPAHQQKPEETEVSCAHCGAPEALAKCAACDGYLCDKCFTTPTVERIERRACQRIEVSQERPVSESHLVSVASKYCEARGHGGLWPSRENCVVCAMADALQASEERIADLELRLQQTQAGHALSCKEYLEVLQKLEAVGALDEAIARSSATATADYLGRFAEIANDEGFVALAICLEEAEDVLRCWRLKEASQT